MGLDMFLDCVKVNKENNQVNSNIHEVMYWKKAYAVMDWFETTISRRYPYEKEFYLHNCAMYTMGKEDIEQLLLWCRMFVKDPKEALGKIKQGWYEERWGDYEKAQCERTIIEIEKLLNDDDIDYFIFHGWW